MIKVKTFVLTSFAHRKRTGYTGKYEMSRNILELTKSIAEFDFMVKILMMTNIKYIL